MFPRISLWESLSEDEKNKVYVGSASSYSLRLNKQTKKNTKINKQKKVTSSRRHPCGYSKILFDLLLIDHCKR